MSQDFNDPELFTDFILEAKEHLETIEPNLLELEKAPDNLSLLNEIFRPMHSLKGASGFLGLNRMNMLAHRAENILDELRKGSMHVTSEIMDVILSAKDALQQMVENLEGSGNEGDVDIQPVVNQLDGIMSSQGKAAAPAPAASATAPAAAPTISAAAPAAAPVTSAAASAATANVNTPEAKKYMDTEDWIASLTKIPPYNLTAFGTEHLNDFIEEAKDNVSNIGSGLLLFETAPGEIGDTVNDIFRYFHNLKGNSGILGYQEMNKLTHAAETLLNLVRQDQMKVSSPLVDLLLLVTDVLEDMLARINTTSGQVTPVDISELVTKLDMATNGAAVEMPDSLVIKAAAGAPAASGATSGAASGASAEAAAPGAAPGITASDLATYKETIRQQFEVINAALGGLKTNSTDGSLVDAMYRSLVTIKNSSSYMGFDEVKVYAERTAGLVDQSRKSGLDFALMQDLSTQETDILHDITMQNIEKATKAISASASAPAAPVQASAAATPVAAPAQASVATAPAQASGAAPGAASSQSAPVAAPEPTKTAPAAAASPAAVPASEAAHTPAAATKSTPESTAKPGAAPATKPAAGAEAQHSASSTIRVDHEKLDHLMNLIGELIINRNRYTMLARRLEGVTNPEVAIVAQDLSETTYALARISDDLQDTIMKVRMVPVSSVFSRFPRLVRDLSRKSDKEVELILQGEETELDKSVVEVIGDPLVHLIRNSVDHGIEHEDVRRAAGKDPKGKVWLRAYHKGNSVVIEIEDDGKGIDPVGMREAAVRKGVATADEVKAMDDREAVELIFAPGFSTAEKITDISGRGVGMDVVRTNIKSLKGSINTSTEVGKGTRFTLSLPLTLAIIDALMVSIDGATYAIPLDAVAETTKIEASRLTDVKGRKAVTMRGEVLGIVSLAALMDLPCHMHEHEVLSVVVIHDNDRRLGLVVDHMLERQEVVIKPLGAYLGDLKGISGATIMGDGGVILIMDPHELYLMATSKAL
ncbi:MAG: Hpt domain-containing protein [Deltaproteobacteria bacterium]|jgi:two-component system chemotaxis sensor kinase CheA|nr:Hpt domain-containing protein [Deltaproteobacteria bacterium]